VYLRDFLLSTAHYGRLYAPRWSATIQRELAKNLIEDGKVHPHAAEHLLATMRSAFPLAEFSSDGRLIPCVTNDPKDRHLVETALTTRAEVIVTFNLSDFRDSDLSPVGLVAVAPDAFLLDVYRGYEHVLPSVLSAQTHHYRRRPLKVAELAIALQKVIPATISLLAETSP
jgi:predicted nucleic acid-binding protein